MDNAISLKAIVEPWNSSLSLLECGYTEADIETASPDDMNVYYSKDNQQKYGVVGIRIALLCGT